MKTKIRPNKLVTPVLKWVGGKRQLLGKIKQRLPSLISNYYEPFVGGGALLFSLQPSRAVINDLNKDLINVYRTIKVKPTDLIEDLKKHKNEANYFYTLRALDRSPQFENLSDVEKASRTIYLNKTCFNGLYRVNNSGEFNSPFGGYKNPNVVNEIAIRAVSTYFNQSKIEILNGDFEAILKGARGKKSFVYLDPPYDPVSKSPNFTGYNQGGFNRDEQLRLRNLCDKLNRRGVKFLLSNSVTDFIKDLYQNYTIETIKATRAINSDGTKRGEVEELLIRNYD